MPRTCPRCRTPQTVPSHPVCVACGAPVPVEFAPMGTLRGARLTGAFLEGELLEFPLGGVTSIGRHPGNVLRLSDREVSKEHALIEQQGNQYVLRDLGSSNGTFVNGRRVKELRLREGDELVLGSSRLLFRLGEETLGETRGVTVVASSLQVPAILAQLAPERDDEFRPAEQISDVAALRQDYEKLRIAHEFHRQVGNERSTQVLLEKILKVSFQLVAADNGVLFLHQPGQGLTPAAVKHRKPESGDVVLSETVLQRVMETRQAVLTADAIIDSRFSASESIVAQGIRSAMAVPLLSSDVLRGVLFVDSRERINAFSEKDLKLLSGLAGQAAVALENVELAQKIEREALTRAELSRFLSPAVADMVVRGQVELLRQARLADVSVLFADIRGFTRMAENDEPQEVVSMLNEFFAGMADVVFRHEGNLDKFIGDCVMAVWGPPSSHADDPARALRAALQMHQEVDRINARRIAAGRPPLEVGIGVNTGQAVVGYMGSAERHEFTAIGDSVNVASRLCGIAKGGEVLATHATVSAAGGGFEVEVLPLTNVKGKEREVRAYRVIGQEHTANGIA